MDVAGAGAALVLAATLLWAGAAKLGRPITWRLAVTELRLPPILGRRWVARVAPVVEIALAVTLLAAPAGALLTLASAAVLILMVAYTAVIARALGFDPRPRCGCFGEVGAGRVGWATLARNLGLSTLAVLVLVPVAGGRAVGRSLLEHPIGWWLLGLTAVTVMVLVVRGRRRPALGRIGDRLRDGTGGEVPLAELLGAADRGHVHLLTVDCTCAAASRALGRLAEWDAAAGTRTVPVSLFDPAATTRSFPRGPDQQPWLFPGEDWAQSLTPDEPSLLRAATDGAVVEVVTGPDAIRAWFEGAAHGRAR